MAEEALKCNGRACFYSQLMPGLREVAFKCGYALGLHGSMNKDLDLIAAPWTEEAVYPERLIECLAAHCGGYVPQHGHSFVEGKWVPREMPGKKPHGRRAWTISFGGDVYLDISVMPMA